MKISWSEVRLTGHKPDYVMRPQPLPGSGEILFTTGKRLRRIDLTAGKIVSAKNAEVGPLLGIAPGFNESTAWIVTARGKWKSQLHEIDIDTLKVLRTVESVTSAGAMLLLPGARLGLVGGRKSLTVFSPKEGLVAGQVNFPFSNLVIPRGDGGFTLCSFSEGTARRYASGLQPVGRSSVLARGRSPIAIGKRVFFVRDAMAPSFKERVARVASGGGQSEFFFPGEPPRVIALDAGSLEQVSEGPIIEELWTLVGADQAGRLVGQIGRELIVIDSHSLDVHCASTVPIPGIDDHALPHTATDWCMPSPNSVVVSMTTRDVLHVARW